MNRDKNLSIIMRIIRYECGILDIGTQVGATRYIDFIKESDVQYSIMKGVDCFRRSFIVIKTEIILPDKSKKDIMLTFFQRYTDEYLLWCGCSNMMNTDGECRDMINTEGGLSVDQFEFIYNLISNGYVDINDTIKTNCRLQLDLIKIQIKE